MQTRTKRAYRSMLPGGAGTVQRIWSSSKVLREFLKIDVFVPTKRVELGCGTGVVGITRQNGSGESVLLTDGGSDALLKLAEENDRKMASRISPCISSKRPESLADAEVREDASTRPHCRIGLYVREESHAAWRYYH